MRHGPRARRALAFSAVGAKPFVLANRCQTLLLDGVALLLGTLQPVSLNFELSALAYTSLAVCDRRRAGGDQSCRAIASVLLEFRKVGLALSLRGLALLLG